VGMGEGRKGEEVPEGKAGADTHDADVIRIDAPASEVKAGKGAKSSDKATNKEGKGGEGIWKVARGQGVSVLGSSPLLQMRDPRKHCIGVLNMGATCYIASVLNLLYFNTDWREAVLSWTPADAQLLTQAPSAAASNEAVDVDADVVPSENTLQRAMDDWMDVAALQRVFMEMKYSLKKALDIHVFVKQYKLDAGYQQDVNEFVKVLLQHLESVFLRSKHLPASLQTSIARTFQGTQSYVTTCMRCKTQSRRSTPFMDIEVPIHSGHKTVEHLLQALFTCELLSGDNAYACSVCSSKETATRELQIDQYPSTLHIQLLRFVFDPATMGKKKVKDGIAVPDVLDLTQTEMGVTTGDGDGCAIYELMGVVSHLGTSAYQGHYVTSMWSSDHSCWWRIDDADARKLANGNVGPACHNPTPTDLETFLASPLPSPLLTDITSAQAPIPMLEPVPARVPIAPTAPMPALEAVQYIHVIDGPPEPSIQATVGRKRGRKPAQAHTELVDVSDSKRVCLGSNVVSVSTGPRSSLESLTAPPMCEYVVIDGGSTPTTAPTPVAAPHAPVTPAPAAATSVVDTSFRKPFRPPRHVASDAAEWLPPTARAAPKPAGRGRGRAAAVKPVPADAPVPVVGVRRQVAPPLPSPLLATTAAARPAAQPSVHKTRTVAGYYVKTPSTMSEPSVEAYTRVRSRVKAAGKTPEADKEAYMLVYRRMDKEQAAQWIRSRKVSPIEDAGAVKKSSMVPQAASFWADRFPSRASPPKPAPVSPCAAQVVAAVHAENVALVAAAQEWSRENAIASGVAVSRKQLVTEAMEAAQQHVLRDMDGLVIQTKALPVSTPPSEQFAALMAYHEASKTCLEGSVGGTPAPDPAPPMLALTPASWLRQWITGADITASQGAGAQAPEKVEGEERRGEEKKEDSGVVDCTIVEAPKTTYPLWASSSFSLSSRRALEVGIEWYSANCPLSTAVPKLVPWQQFTQMCASMLPPESLERHMLIRQLRPLVLLAAACDAALVCARGFLASFLLDQLSLPDCTPTGSATVTQSCWISKTWVSAAKKVLQVDKQRSEAVLTRNWNLKAAHEPFTSLPDPTEDIICMHDEDGPIPSMVPTKGAVRRVSLPVWNAIAILTSQPSQPPPKMLPADGQHAAVACEACLRETESSKEEDRSGVLKRRHEQNGAYPPPCALPLVYVIVRMNNNPFLQPLQPVVCGLQPVHPVVIQSQVSNTMMWG
jgi:hypothetical protein